jgi:hypothetical protein
VLADGGGGDERKAVARRPEDEVVRRVGPQRVDERRRVGAELGRAEALLQLRDAAVEDADLERDGPGIDAGDARAAVRRRPQASCSFAIS